MKELDIVVALKDLHEGKVTSGTEGTVLEVFLHPDGCIVEFDDIESDDVFLVDCFPGDVAQAANWKKGAPVETPG